MTRIFLTLAVFSTILLAVAFTLGLNIGDPKAVDEATRVLVRWHFRTALAALVFACLVHAIMLTYFMGTGRWIEDTSKAYRLSDQWSQQSRSLKYRTFPAMIGCVVLLVLTAAFGAAADPAASVNFRGWFGLSPDTIHLLIASTTFGVNLLVNLREFQSIDRNGQLVDGVLQEVRRIREEHGLPVDG